MSFLKILIKNNDRIHNNKDKIKEIDNSINEINIKDNMTTSSQINNFVQIDSKNTFSIPETKQAINFEIYSTKFKDNEELINDNITRVKNKFFEKISNSTFTDDYFIISQNICKLICKNIKISKDYINIIIKNIMKKDFYYEHSLLLNKDNCEIIGTILCYSFSRLQQYKIKDIYKLIEIRKIILEKGIDVENDYIKYCKENKNTDNKITDYWKTQRNKYILLPELIFLINRYSLVSEIKVDFNLFNESLNEDKMKTQLIELTILSIHWLFDSIKTFKINLINEKLQKILYNYYLKKLNKFCSDINVKKNILTKEHIIYQPKWNFEHFFKLEEFRAKYYQDNLLTNCISNIKIFNKKSAEIKEVINKITTLPFSNIKRNSMIPNNSNFSNDLSTQIKNNLNIINNINSNNRNNSTNNAIKEKKKHNIVVYYQNIFELILINLFGINNSDNCNNLEIIMNDSYTNEFLIFIKGILEFGEIDENIQEFNILDLLIYNNKIKNIITLNIEINTLDFTSFENLLNILYNNKSLTSINLSFFSSNITYYPQTLYKLFKEHNDENILKYNDKNNYSYEENFNIDEKILNKLSSNYVYNLTVLFDIIKNMTNLDEVGLNFDIPDNILNNPNYMNPILKFIINMLIYTLNNSKFKKVCLLSPRTFFDNRKIPNIYNLINNMNINNSIIKDLSLQFQFHQISNINNFVSTRLEILNIGDLDIFTFKLLCDNICSPSFNLNSSLQKLSIGLLNSIIDFKTEIKRLLRKLFSIKIKYLTNLNLYTNIIIDNDMEYDYLFKILNYNWISEYTFLFNSKSEQIMVRISEDINKLKYFVPHNLERQLLNANDIMNLKSHPITLEIDNNKDYYDDAFWYLKYLFEYVYVDKMKNDNRIKNIIMGILKYLYILKTPKINQPNSQ